LLEKKFRCSELRPALEKSYQGTITEVGELFYSRALNTCVLTSITERPGKEAWELHRMIVQIIDALTGKSLFFDSTSVSAAEQKNPALSEIMVRFNQLLAELQAGSKEQ
jgi:hypothetical protein